MDYMVLHRMSKTIYNSKYQDFLETLRSQRIKAGISQVELAEQLGVTQSYISKWERAERRLDLIEVLQYCKAIGINHSDFSRYIKNLKIL